MKISISSLLVATFLAIALIGTPICAYFLYSSLNSVLTKEIYDNLNSATKSRSEHIKTYLNGVSDVAEIMSNSIILPTFIATEKNSSDYAANKANAQKRLDQIKKAEPDYDEVFVIGLDGFVALSSDPGKVGADKRQDSFFTDGLEKTTIKSVYFSEITSKPQIGISTPLKDSTGKVVGVYAARINTNTLISILSDLTGLGESGEIVILDNSSRAITPLKYRENAGLNIKIDTSLTRQCLAGIAAYRGPDGGAGPQGEGAMVYPDYRGVIVLGTYNYALPQMPWCVIAKIDESEALGAPRDKLIGVFFTIGSVLLLLAGAALYLVSRLVSWPLRRLSDDVAKITKGDLDTRLKPSYIFEIQSLTDSLNRLLASLKLAVLRAGISKDDMGIGDALLAGKTAEAKLNAIYNNSSEALMTLGAPSWKFISGNPSAVRMFGAKDEQEFISMTPWVLSPEYQPDGQPSDKLARKMIMKALDEGSAFFEWTHRRRNGEDFPATVLLMKMNVGGKDLLQATVRDITEQKKMGENLEYELKFSKTVLSAMQQGVDIVDENLNIVYMNPAFEKIFGKDCVGKKCYQVYKDNKRQCEACPLKKPIKVGETRAIVVPGIKESRIFEISHTGMVLPNGKKAILELFRDITAEIESTERKRLFELGFESSPDSQLMVDYADGKPKIARINASFTKYYGYSPDEVIGKNPKIIKSGAQNAEYYKSMWKALLDPKVGYWRDEIINKRKDGGHMNVLLVINTIFDKGGKPRSFLASHLDMSGQRRAEKELSSSKALQQAALDSIHDSFFICDTKGRFLSWNKEFREATGYSDAEIPLLQATDLFSGMDVVRVANAIRKGLKTGTATVRANVIAKDKTLLPTEFSGTVLKNQNGKIIGFTGVGRRLKHI